jgi:hypothetical protein
MQFFSLPFFNKVFMLAFAGNNHVPKLNWEIPELISDMKQLLKSNTKWLKDSGLVLTKTKPNYVSSSKEM